MLMIKYINVCLIVRLSYIGLYAETFFYAEPRRKIEEVFLNRDRAYRPILLSNVACGCLSSAETVHIMPSTV